MGFKPVRCLQGEIFEPVTLEDKKHHKKPFGHHGAKPGLPFCTHEGMGQVRCQCSGKYEAIRAYKQLHCWPLHKHCLSPELRRRGAQAMAGVPMA